MTDQMAVPTLDRGFWLRCIAAAGVTIGFLFTVYVPAFAVVRILRLPVNNVVPTIMVITMAMVLVWAGGLIASGRFSLADFGLKSCRARYAVGAVAVSIPLALGVAWLLEGAHEPGPLSGLTLSPFLAWLYFAVFAPIQEECIFRGLVQSVATRVMERGALPNSRAAIMGVLIAAAVFAVVHLVVGPWTAAAALLLGLIAGDFRRRSNSLLPAILVHSAFNVGALLIATR